MAVNEQIVTGRKFRKLVDEATKLWQRISFWTKASDVEFDDGLTAETKMGAINGITDSLVSTSSNIAASAKALSTLNNDLSGCKLTTEGSGANTKYYIQNGADAASKKPLGNVSKTKWVKLGQGQFSRSESANKSFQVDKDKCLGAIGMLSPNIDWVLGFGKPSSSTVTFKFQDYFGSISNNTGSYVCYALYIDQ